MANIVLCGRSRSRTFRMAATSGAIAEPQAAVATKQPLSWVNFMDGVVNVTEAIGEAGLHGSTVRTATAYCVPDFRGPMVTEARVPGRRLHLRRHRRRTELVVCDGRVRCGNELHIPGPAHRSTEAW